MTTCKCGANPIEEYGERCPSCPRIVELELDEIDQHVLREALQQYADRRKPGRLVGSKARELLVQIRSQIG